MRFESIASGSSGNCIYAGSENTHLLMDVGISRKRTVQALQEIGLSIDDIDGIFLTHEHADHIAGLPVITRYSSMPVYATRGTIEALKKMPKCSGIDPDRFICVRADEPVTVGDLRVDPMQISHDAAEPVGYRIYDGEKKACVCTDLGCYTDYTLHCLEDSDVLLLESNHDVNMLQVGSYPYRLKQRILGARGHLSNASSGQLLSRILNDHLKGIFLGHLSKENNYPELAFETVRCEIMFSENGYRPEELPIQVADRDKPSRLVEF
ncbi:MAG: MBL fold metallo-hydrolase [Eubacteriales bacterium]|nr:MBL fold metallo-hydrolase [Sarcina sp.]MBR2729589.1 MBL fold metallo-hydrolase [Lachnospiraceae bacterium]MDO4416833.1 MBL fold metallo-hydrolase [Eubacteriales bacterium]